MIYFLYVRWIQYSALDAIATWCVREQLEARLRKMPWVRFIQSFFFNSFLFFSFLFFSSVFFFTFSFNLLFFPIILQYVEDTRLLGTMYDYYLEYLLPFGELLTEMEQNGAFILSFNLLLLLLLLLLLFHHHLLLILILMN